MNHPGLKILLCAPNQATASETFIANHIRMLPGKVVFAYGGMLPSFVDGEPYQAHPHPGLGQRTPRQAARRASLT